jgi:hypothetical protein
MSRAWRWKTRWPAGIRAQQHEVALQKERNTSQILMGVLIIGVMLALWAVI